MSAKRCQGTTRAGNPCRATPRSDTGCCNAHSPKEVQESCGFGGSQPGAGRPRQPRVVEVMRERIEADVERIVKPYFDAIENAILTATHEGIVIPSDVADLGARIAAAEKLLDRVYGKPKQALEHTGPDGQVPTVDVNLSDQAREAIAGALRGRPATRGQ